MAKKETTSGPKTIKVKFLKSPTGAYGLGYGIGAVAPFEAKQAQEMIDDGFAEKV